MPHISIPIPTPTFHDMAPLTAIIHQGGMPVAIILSLAIFVVLLLNQVSKFK